MKYSDVIIIGGSAAGMVTALTGKQSYPDKSFTIFRKEEKVMVPCGIPYIFGQVGSSEKNIMPAEDKYEKMGIDLKVDEIVDIDKGNKIIKSSDGEEYKYNKLIFATGSTPYKPKWLKNTDLENVFFVPKSKVYLDKMHEKLKSSKKIVIIGAGFIGVELSDELNYAGLNITLVEMLPQILDQAFDENIAEEAEKQLIERGINVIKNNGVKELVGDKKVKGIKFKNDEFMEADAVIIATGYEPNSDLAIKAGIKVSDHNFIKVDEYMRTDDKDILAVGDCAEKKDFITRRASNVMLASTACAEARTAGLNLFKLSAVKTFTGTISIFSTAIGNTGFGVAGLTEKKALREGFDIVTGEFEGVDKHPGTLPNSHKQKVMLIVGKENGKILGGEVIGGLSIGELVNVIGFIIQSRMTVNTLLTSQIGSHPLLTASPAGYPLLKAAENAISKMMHSKN